MAVLPTQEELDAAEIALRPYFLALGRVAHFWNHLHEELGKLFCSVSCLELYHGMSIWHELKSDRSQRDILRGIVQTRLQEEDWTKQRPKVAEAIIELLNATNTLAERRNNAIHAPCSVSIRDGVKELEIIPVTFFGNDKAKRLSGKDILSEFKWYEESAETLRRWTVDCRFAVDACLSSPQKPHMPTRGQANRRR